MSQKTPRNTRKKLHAQRVRAERELKAELKEQGRRNKGDDAEWREVLRSLKGVAEWTDHTTQ